MPPMYQFNSLYQLTKYMELMSLVYNIRMDWEGNDEKLRFKPLPTATTEAELNYSQNSDKNLSAETLK